MSDFVPHGYCTLLEVFERMGCAYFGAMWTGSENESGAPPAAQRRADALWRMLRQLLWDGNLPAITIDGREFGPITSRYFADDDSWHEIKATGRVVVSRRDPFGQRLLIRAKDAQELVAAALEKAAAPPAALGAERLRRRCKLPAPLSPSAPSDERPVNGLRSISAARLREWYCLRVDTWPASDPPPNRNDDEVAARAHFGHPVSRPLLRDLRRELAPAAWQRQGRRRRR